MLSLVDADSGKAMQHLTKKFSMRNHRLVLSTSIMIVLTTSAGCVRHENAPAKEAELEKAAQVASEPSADNSSAPPPPGSSTPSQELLSLAYICEAGPVCDADILGANTPEEARWLLQNGYPSSELLNRLEAMSDRQLKREADRGSLAAMVNYGQRLASQGDTDAGLVYIFDATQRGSIYGYYAMSRVYGTPGLGGIVESGAYLRVAYILGDSKASDELQRRFPGLQQMEQAAIDRRASQLYQSFAHSRQPTPRP
ncbi:hypothetical protein [Stenotrophomonas rhizophila]|uniref:hypothetical protein n=2 Tax=Stenotrophomonas rhizophila TaxID=216778 RepID=UPI0015C4F20C|nr:hypothetical protein [Stenotrophomonas rhizophila]